MNEQRPYLLLKWGTLKGWGNITSPETQELLKKYHESGVSMSAMSQHDSPEQKAILVELIRQHAGDIVNDWSGENYSSDEAIAYIANYGIKEAAL